MVDKNPTSRTSCTLSLYMSKKDKTADGALRRLLVSLPRFSGADFCGEWTGHFRSSSRQFWKSVRSEHKLIAWSYLSNRAFSHDVTAAILVFQNNETAPMLVYQENPLGVEFFSYVNAFFCSNKLV